MDDEAVAGFECEGLFFEGAVIENAEEWAVEVGGGDGAFANNECRRVTGTGKADATGGDMDEAADGSGESCRADATGAHAAVEACK